MFIISVITIAVAIAAALAPVSAVTVERNFSTTVYPQIQRAVTPLSNLLPFALFDVVTVAAVAAVVIELTRGVRQARRERRIRPLLVSAYRVITGAAVVYLVFLALWGLNYRRVSMAERLEMQQPDATREAVFQLGLDSVARMNQLHNEAHRLGWPADPRRDNRLLEAFAIVQRLLSDAAPAVPGRLKHTLYGPYFRWTTVDGMVNPFGLEVLANSDLLPFEQSFVAAHEWAHLAGYADESEANFVGWLTCVRADEPAQYSAWLYLFWQIYAESGSEDRMRLWNALEAGPREDIVAIRQRLERGQLPLLRNVSWRVYDRYLRANRVEEGIRSYGKVVTLLVRARFEEGWKPVRRLPSAPSR